MEGNGERVSTAICRVCKWRQPSQRQPTDSVVGQRGGGSVGHGTGCDGQGGAWHPAGMPEGGGGGLRMVCGVVRQTLKGPRLLELGPRGGSAGRVAPFPGVVGAMVEAQCPLAGGCGIVTMEDFIPGIQIIEKIPALCDDEVIMWGGKVVCDSHGVTGLCVSPGPTSPGQAARSGLGCPVTHRGSSPLDARAG
jgi:hypothetical protein